MDQLIVSLKHYNVMIHQYVLITISLSNMQCIINKINKPKLPNCNLLETAEYLLLTTRFPPGGTVSRILVRPDSIIFMKWDNISSIRGISIKSISALNGGKCLVYLNTLILDMSPSLTHALKPRYRKSGLNSVFVLCIVGIICTLDQNKNPMIEVTSYENRPLQVVIRTIEKSNLPNLTWHYLYTL